MLNKSEFNDFLTFFLIRANVSAMVSVMFFFFNPHPRTHLLILEREEAGGVCGGSGEKHGCKRETLTDCLP